MIKNFFLSSVCILSLLITITGCKDDKIDPEVNASVAIAKGKTETATTLSVVFTPDQYAAGFKYYIGSPSDADGFAAGTLEGIEERKGNEEFEVTFLDLKPETGYTVFAVAYNSNGINGRVATLDLTTASGQDEKSRIESLTVSFSTDEILAFKFEANKSMYIWTYALGKEGDLEKFENGTLAGIETLRAAQKYTRFYYDLDPSTEYVFFVRGEDHNENKTETKVLSAKTMAAGSCPTVEYEIEKINAVFCHTRFTPDDKVSGYYIAIGTDGYFESSIAAYGGDVVQYMVDMVNDSKFELSRGEEKITTELLMETNSPYETMVIIFGLDGNPANILRYKFKSPAHQAGLQARVDIEIEDTDHANLVALYTPNEDVVLFFYEHIPLFFITENIPDFMRDLNMTYDEAYDMIVFYFLRDEGAFAEYTDPVRDIQKNTGLGPDFDLVASAFPVDANGEILVINHQAFTTTGAPIPATASTSSLYGVKVPAQRKAVMEKALKEKILNNSVNAVLR